MGIFNRKIDDSPEGQELKAARHALATDPVNTGALGAVDADSPAAQRNFDVQDRLNAAEVAYRNR